jgi:hypothetical protein
MAFSHAQGFEKLHNCTGLQNLSVKQQIILSDGPVVTFLNTNLGPNVRY